MNHSKYLIDHTATLRRALERLNSLSGDSMTLFVTNDDRLVGTLTDGDVRRALIAGCSLDDTVDKAAYTGYKFVTGCPGDVDTLRSLREQSITMVPLVDADRRLVDVLDLSVTHNRLPLAAILMAGGKGERLRPLTLSTPKPLLEIDGKAIIDYNVEALAAAGIDDITVTVNYLAEQLEDHFAKPVAGVQVRTVRENIPLGTIGAAALCPIADAGQTLVMNSDLLTTVSFEDMYIHHRDHQADVTIAVIPYQVSVPYAILDVDNDIVLGIEEKPSYSYYANAGIYIFDNKLLATLPRESRTDATDLVEQAISNGRRVTYFPINGTWIDVGSPVDFRQAAEVMKHHRNLSRGR